MSGVLLGMTVNSVAITPNYANNPTVFAGTRMAGVFSNTLVDTTPPTTTASPSGGSYSRALVTLTCDDGVGSGCNKIYYTLDGSIPTTNSPVYSRPINISATTTLKFFSIDRAGNEEAVKTEVYTIEPALQWIMSILSPNGGEVVPTGSAYSIDWWAPPETVKFDLGYSLNGAPWKLIAKNVVGYSYNWTVPTLTRNEGNCRVGIRGYDALGKVTGTDTSDSPFTLEVVKITHPNGGEVLYSGKVYTIRWQTNQTVRPVSSVKIYGSPNEGAPGTWRLLTTIQGNPGYWDWTVPSVNTPKSRYRLGVVLLDAAGTNIGQDASDANFIINHVP